MPAPPIKDARAQRLKDTIEAAMRDGFNPFRASLGGKGSSVREAARRLRELGYPETDNTATDFIRRQSALLAKGLPAPFMPDAALFAKPGIAPAKMRAGRIYRWILTAAQDDTDVHPGFWANLQAYARTIGADIMVAGFTYQQVRHTDRMTLANTYRPELRTHLRFDPVDCGPVLFCAEMNTLPTAVRPLSGLVTYSRGRDAVFPHAKLAYQTVPQKPGTPAPSMMTTGAVTVPNYIEKKAGLKAEFHHVLGATIVEVDNTGTSWCRQIHAAADGSFQDLDARVSKGIITRGHRVKAVTWGDIHLPSVPDEIHAALWGAGGMLETLKPEYQFFHDLIDFAAWSRHVEGDPLHRARMVHRGLSGVEAQVVGAARFLRETQRDFCRSVMVESNHDDRLLQWTRRDANRCDIENVAYWHRMNLAVLEAELQGVVQFNLLRWALKSADHADLDGIDFVPIGGSFVICQDSGGIECGMHGHLGPNGTKGSALALTRMASKVTMGDKHAPEIADGVFVAGITGALDQGYNVGPSSWRRAHVVAYPNGKRSLVTQADEGRWRA